MDRQKVEVLDFLTFHCNRLITVCLSRPDLNKKNSKKKKKKRGYSVCVNVHLVKTTLFAWECNEETFEILKPII